jgi:uncharacterized protein
MTQLGRVSKIPSRHASTADKMVNRVLTLVEIFYHQNPQIKASHGLEHVMRVYHHASKALECCCQLSLSAIESMEIRVAALLHDVDDSKYFPHSQNYENARSILAQAAGIIINSQNQILQMISWVSCSKNGNRIPAQVEETSSYHLLIPRWADRLEAVGAIGVVRAYQYNQEHADMPLCSETSPRATCVNEVWKLATPERFDCYLKSNGHSDDMISHYFDKLLHVACPPPDRVRNAYIERMAQDASNELMQVCLRFGRTGKVDEAYIRQVAERIGA